jgi:hypothetical protein
MAIVKLDKLQGYRNESSYLGLLGTQIAQIHTGLYSASSSVFPRLSASQGKAPHARICPGLVG